MMCGQIMKTNTPKENKTDFTIKSVHKALDIVEFLSDHSGDASVKELSDALGINKSTVSKMLLTLAHHDFVRQNPQTLRYRIGFKPLLIAQKTVTSIEIQTIAEPFLLQLREETGETVNFAINAGGTLTYVATYEGRYPVRLSSTAGMSASLTNSAVGKAALAFMKEPKRSELVQKEVGHMDEQQKVGFLKNIEATKERGFSINIDELTEGVSGVGAPVFDYMGDFVAAVAVAGLSARMDMDRLITYGRKLVPACKAISKELGFGG